MISIITINFNNKNGLIKTLNSVISQTSKEFEWIIIDGGSTDGSKELLENYSEHISYWVSEPDNGIYHAMNKGIKKANGKYLLFLNSGDYLFNETVIEKSTSFINTHSEDFIIGDISKENDSRINNNIHLEYSCNSIIYKLSFSSLPHPSSFIKKEIFEKYGYYREDIKIVSDWFLFYSAIIINNASIIHFPLTITTFNEEGISSTNEELCIKEREKLLSENIYLQSLLSFYRDYFELINAIKNNKIFNLIVRTCFFMHRKLKK